jgi:chemotaxis protein MotB
MAEPAPAAAAPLPPPAAAGSLPTPEPAPSRETRPFAPGADARPGPVAEHFETRRRVADSLREAAEAEEERARELPDTVAGFAVRRASRVAASPDESGQVWLVTYGDMLTQLLCVFVILLAALLAHRLGEGEQADVAGLTGRGTLVAAQLCVGGDCPPGGAPGEEPSPSAGPAPAASFEAVPQAAPPLPALPDPTPPAPAVAGPATSPVAVPTPPDGEPVDAWAQGVARWLWDAVEADAVRRDASVAVRDREVTVRVGDRVLFDLGRAELRPEAASLIAALGSRLAELGAAVRVEGHTDDLPIATARFPSNWELSAARAASVVRALIAAGMPAARLTATGFAETRPVDPDGTDAARAANRRVEIVVLPPRGTY